ncbi:MAG: hypothetical protein PHW95_04760 [Patescibacteria group bacterium]|nr:hypothetical protein [Patescibacteria group bacterium]
MNIRKRFLVTVKECYHWALAQRAKNLLKTELMAISRETGAYYYRRCADRQICLVQGPTMDPGTPLEVTIQEYHHRAQTDSWLVVTEKGEYQYSSLEAMMVSAQTIYAKLNRLAS